ncbi:MAG: hypothetical protein Q9223_006098, partial [Gallowayella weberi]
PQATIVAEPVLEPSIATPNDNLPELQDLVAFASEPEVGKHIGYLKELGLDFGWGPTALAEWVLEHVHIYSGTPWWASIVIAMLAIRFTIFKTYVESADISARLLAIKPHMQEIRERLDEAKRAQDMTAIMQYSQEIKNLYQAAGIKIWKSVLPFVNIPIGYGFFRLTRDMSSLPVPGLESGGLLWFTDLTISDPTFLLPIGTGTLTYLMLKLGGELGSVSNLNPGIMKTFQRILPIVTTVFMSFWPAAMQITFFMSGAMGYVQARLLRQDWFRKFWGIHPLPPTVKPGTQTPSVAALKGVMVPPSAPPVKPEAETAQGGVFRNARSKIRSTVSDLKNSAQKLGQEDEEAKKSRRRSSKELEEARRYDEKRKREIEQDKIHRARHPRR